MNTSKKLSNTAKQLALDALCTCKLQGVGTFFLLTSSGLHLLRDSGELVSYDEYLDFTMGRLFVVDQHSLCLMGQASGRASAETFWIIEEDDWKQVYTDAGGLSVSRFATQLTNYTLGSCGLSKLRSGDDHDFKIVCREGTVFPVHRIILNRQWKYFKLKLGSEPLKTLLHINATESVVEAIVSDLYEENKPLAFDDAVALLTVAHVYELPNLLLRAMRRIKTRGLAFEEAVVVWKHCHASDNKPLRLYCSDIIFRATVMSAQKSPPELLTDLTQDQYSLLFSDFNEVTQ